MDPLRAGLVGLRYLLSGRHGGWARRCAVHFGNQNQVGVSGKRDWGAWIVYRPQVHAARQGKACVKLASASPLMMTSCPRLQPVSQRGNGSATSPDHAEDRGPVQNEVEPISRLVNVVDTPDWECQIIPIAYGPGSSIRGNLVARISIQAARPKLAWAVANDLVGRFRSRYECNCASSVGDGRSAITIAGKWCVGATWPVRGL